MGLRMRIKIYCAIAPYILDLRDAYIEIPFLRINLG